MLEGQQVARGFVRRVADGNEEDVVEMEAPHGGVRDGQMAQVNWIEGATEKARCAGPVLLRAACAAARFALNAPP